MSPRPIRRPRSDTVDRIDRLIEAHRGRRLAQVAKIRISTWKHIEDHLPERTAGGIGAGHGQLPIGCSFPLLFRKKNAIRRPIITEKTTAPTARPTPISMPNTRAVRIMAKTLMAGPERGRPRRAPVRPPGCRSRRREGERCRSRPPGWSRRRRPRCKPGLDWPSDPDISSPRPERRRRRSLRQ